MLWYDIRDFEFAQVGETLRWNRGIKGKRLLYFRHKRMRDRLENYPEGRKRIWTGE